MTITQQKTTVDKYCLAHWDGQSGQVVFQLNNLDGSGQIVANLYNVTQEQCLQHLRNTLDSLENQRGAEGESFVVTQVMVEGLPEAFGLLVTHNQLGPAQPAGTLTALAGCTAFQEFKEQLLKLRDQVGGLPLMPFHQGAVRSQLNDLLSVVAMHVDRNLSKELAHVS